ncbi:hypothetical protein H6P81_007992 [Aristolochia fimbriata]|uniref:Uncharacterized protein n=1 Tax=Aristolochia fimbriata TaxID=158543 RepID=A0AAV7F6A4_ARIFI|nr:hypothetical protein H6P81_007992 [Aristolochia fimbriata]
MGKSGGRRKKGGNSAPSDAPHPSPAGANGVDLDSPLFLKRAHELKEEGNRRFQTKDYAGALDQYNKALQLTPKTHPDRAVFHSNRAACLMQMKPVDYDTVVSECSMALQVQPRFGRALLRRARAYEALAKYDLALEDVQALLVADPNHRDALEIAGRLRVALGPRNEAQQDLQSRPSPAALGASAVRGAPIAGLGPLLPARPVPKKTAPNGSQATASIKLDKLPSQAQEQSSPKTVSKPFKLSSDPALLSPRDGNSKNSRDISLQPSVLGAASLSATTRWRRLKLVYGHDIRLAQMPANCGFRILREIVAKRFPSSKSVLVKYKDMEGDLVTITSTQELKLAESCADHLIPKEKTEGSDTGKKDNPLMVLRLHVVEVDPEQEPALVDEEEKPAVVDDEGVKVDESRSLSSAGDSVSEGTENDGAVSEDAVIKPSTGEEIQKEKTADIINNNVECKEVEIDDWLYEFAQLFRTHVGIDPDAHIDLHELGMELCSEALEETVTSEEAQGLFEMAASKFQEVAALAFFNWGNVHMCAARKRIPLDESSSKEVMTQQLQNAFDWVQERYSLAGQKYEEALRIKPDFYEGLLALGQQHFETAKLQWSFALANKVDLTSWKYEETIKLFDSAEEKMKAATEMWEKLEEQRTNELKDPSASKKDELLKRRKKQTGGTEGQPSGDVSAELTPEEAAEQAAVMRSQIHLFWGNMLFERSQVEFKLGLGGWQKNLDAAVERFKLAGASETDISVVLKNHLSNGVGTDGDDKKTSSTGADAVKVNGKHEVWNAMDRSNGFVDRSQFRIRQAYLDCDSIMGKSEGDEKVLYYNDVVLRRSDMEILSGPYFLNDRLIEFYFSYLSSKYSTQDILLVPPSISFWIANCPDLSSLKDFIEPLKLAIRKLVFFTVNDNNDMDLAEGGNHWSLLVYDRNSNVFVHHDSIRGSNGRHAQKLYKAVTGFMTISGSSSGASFTEGPTPQQENGYDCGLYCLTIAEVICEWYESGCHESDDRWFTILKESVNGSAASKLRTEILRLIQGLMSNDGAKP